MPDRLVVDLDRDGQAKVLSWPEHGLLPEEVSRGPLAWPLDTDALEDLRWYLEDYLALPYGGLGGSRPGRAGEAGRLGRAGLLVGFRQRPGQRRIPADASPGP